MSRFGIARYGSARFGGDAYGLSARYVTGRILAALAPLDKRNGGAVQTLARLTGSLQDPAMWGLVAKAGSPALLVSYEGGPFTIEGAGRSMITQTQTYSVVCIAGDYVDRERRLYGDHVTDMALQRLTRQVMVKAGYALLQVDGYRMTRGTESLRVYASQYFVGVVSFEGAAEIELREPEANLLDRFERLGIVHTPKRRIHIFEDDNITPHTDSPTSPAIGYAEMSDDEPIPPAELAAVIDPPDPV